MNKWQAFSLRDNFRALYVRDGNRDPTLDGLRAISIALVILFHAISMPALRHVEGVQSYVKSLPAYWHWMLQGDKGVDLFFVLSGFLIGGMLLAEKQRTGTIRFGEFYFRRLLRLFPAYALLLLILLGLPLKEDKTYLLANLFYVNNFLDFSNMIAPWTWSLAVEEQFYLALPLFLTAFFWSSTHKSQLLLWLVAVAVTIRAVLLLPHPEFFTRPYVEIVADGNYIQMINDNLYTRFDALMLGVWVAYLQHSHSAALKNWFASRQMRTGLLTAAALLLLFFVMNAPISTMHEEWHVVALFLFHTMHHTLFAIAIAALMICLLNGEGSPIGLRQLLSLPMWQPIAQLTYSIYLFHEVFLLLGFAVINAGLKRSSQTFGIEHIWLLALVTLISSALFAAVIFIFIEKPPMNLRKQLWLALTTTGKKTSSA